MMSVKNLTVLAGLAALALTGAANANTIGEQPQTAGNPFIFTNGSGLSINPTSVRFDFNPGAVALGLTDATPFFVYNAILTTRDSTTGAASGLTPANNYDQPLTGGAPFAFEYRSTTAIGSKPAGSLLLGVTLGAFQLSAAANGNSAAINETNGVGSSTVNFASDFIPGLSAFTDGTAAYSFVNGSSLNTIGAGGQLNNTTFDGSGNFSTRRVVTGVPEPGSVAMLIAGGITGAGFFVRRRRNSK